MPSWKYYEATTTTKTYKVRAMSKWAARETVPEEVAEVIEIKVLDPEERKRLNAVQPTIGPAILSIS